MDMSYAVETSVSVEKSRAEIKDTSCRKCGSLQEPVPPTWRGIKFALTGYRCDKCGHVNNLKTRKPRKEKVK
jgi:uncharacterized Zn finger protein